MIEDKRKIKEIYNCEYIVSNEELYPLQKWYNKLIDKTFSEITVADVLRMIRQKEFINLAIEKAVCLLQDNLFAGEGYDGELLEHILEVDASFLTTYLDELKFILKDASVKMETHEWLFEGEKEDFKGILNAVLKK